MIVLFDFLFNLDCTFFRDLNQVRSTSLKLDKYFSSFVQENSFYWNFFFYLIYSYYSIFPFPWMDCAVIYLSVAFIDRYSILAGIYFFSTSCGNRNESWWSYERELVFTKDREKLHEVCKLQERKLTSRARDVKWLGNL